MASFNHPVAPEQKAIEYLGTVNISLRGKHKTLEMVGSQNLDECMLPAIINFQNGCHISAAVAIIRCTENSDDFLFLWLQR